ncbi:hypothetical protein ACFLZZ_03160 [Nanoarchaeota archaeon]
MGEIDKLIGEVNPKYSKPIWENKISYDTTTGMLEPIYFWIIDFLGGYEQEKLIDNFTATPGSSYFADLGQRATRMQEEGMKILGLVNGVIKSVINILYDLRDFDLRLEKYDETNSEDPQIREQGILGLKEVWMNKVDAQRGMGSVNNMAHQYGFTLLRPAFMAAKSAKAVGDMDLNKMVKSVLTPRVAEFYTWAKFSETELRKRYKVQRTYLKNQVDTLKLYSRWVTPYLKAAEQLRMKDNKEPSLVSVFTSMILELTIMAKNKVDVVGSAKSKSLPPYFAKIAKNLRGFYEIILVDFKFRTYPTQQAPHAGKVEVTFRAYALNEDELILLKRLREDEELSGLLSMSETAVTASLGELMEDIEKYTKEDQEKKKEEKGLFEEVFEDLTKPFKKKTRENILKERKTKEKEEKVNAKAREETIIKEGVKEDNYEEGVVREFGEINAAEFTFKTYDIFKKSQGMASFVSPFDDPDLYKRFRAKRAEIAAMSKG